MTQPDNRIPTHHPQTAARVFSGEVVIITPTENKVRMLNAAGSRVWELADGTRSVDEIADVLAGEFDVDRARARDRAAGFVDELTAKGLLTFA